MPAVEGRYVSQSLGMGGTGGMLRRTSPSPALSERSDFDAAPSPEPMIDDTSLPTLPRRFLSEDDLAAVVATEEPEMEVPDVES